MLIGERHRRPVAGQIARPLGGGISLIDPATGKVTTLVSGESNAIATAVAWSPDRSKLAFSVFHKRPEDRISSAELFVAAATGGSPTLTVPRDQPGSIVDAPTGLRTGNPCSTRIRASTAASPLRGSKRRRWRTADASPCMLTVRSRTWHQMAKHWRSCMTTAPAPACDSGRWTAATPGDRAGERVHVDCRARFCRIGTRIAFTALGRGPVPAGDIPRPASLFAILGPAVAEAHGDPWGTWSVGTDGSDLRTATSLLEDEPLLSWSPDGAWIAVNGGGGLWVVDSRGTGDPRRSQMDRSAQSTGRQVACPACHRNSGPENQTILFGRAGIVNAWVSRPLCCAA